MREKARQILQTAEKLFAAGRFHEVTLDDICKKAGVGKGTIYRYFEDKEALYYQVILSGLDELVESIRQVGEQEEDPAEGLRRAARCMAEFFTERRALFGLMHSEQLRGSTRKGKVWKQLRKKADRMIDVLAHFIRKGMDSDLYVARFSADASARFLTAMIRTGLRHAGRLPGGKNWPVAVVELFENGLLARDRTGPS